MARMVKIVLVALLGGLMLSVYPERADACSCVSPHSHEHLILNSEVIFMGRLVDTRTYTQDAGWVDDSQFVDFKFEVEAVWKGSVPQVAHVSAIVGHGAACADLPYATDFVVGMRYLVYTHESMEIGLCNVVIQEGEDEHRKPYLIEAIGTFEDQVANLGPAGAFSGTGTGEWPPTATPYPLVSTPEAPTPTPDIPTPTPKPPSMTPVPNTPTSPPAVPTPAPSAGGCGRANAVDLAVVGMLAGLAWFAGRRRRF